MKSSVSPLYKWHMLQACRPCFRTESAQITQVKLIVISIVQKQALIQFIMVFAALIQFLLTVASGQEKPSSTVVGALQGFSAEFPAMGSNFQIALYASDERSVTAMVNTIHAEVDRLNSIFSDYEPDSELQRLLKSKTKDEQKISTDLYTILQQAEIYSTLSNGAFDVTVGRLTHLWRANKRRGSLPNKADVDNSLQHVGWQKIRLSKISTAVAISDQALEIDLGGIATGYVVDRCAELLITAGWTQFMINSGGDIRCGDSPPGRDGWRIEVASIETDAPPLRYLVLHNCSVTTSGDLWQYITIDGIRRSHIVDPRTGYGVPGPLSVTVIAPTCLQVDVVATTLSVTGPTDGIALLENNHALENIEALFVWRENESETLNYCSTAGFHELTTLP